MTNPPGTLRVLRLLSGLALRRALNRMSVVFSSKKKDASKRAPTPGKRRRNMIFLALLAVPYLFLIGQLAAQLVGRFSDALDGRAAREDSRVPVSTRTWERLVHAEREIDNVSQQIPPIDNTVMQQYRLDWDNSLLKTFERDWRIETRQWDNATGDNVSRNASVDRMMRVWREKGSQGFVAREPRLPFFGPGVWSHAHDRELAGAMGAVLALVFVCLVFHAFGGRDEPLGAVGWSLEWLFTMPVRAPTLFFGRLVEYALTDLFSWLLLPPVFVTVFVCAGVYWVWAIPAAIFSTLFIALLVASVRLVGDTWLRKTFRPGFLRNLQAVLSVAYLLALFIVMFLAYRPQLPGWITEILPSVGAAAYLPCSWPMLFCLKGWAIPAALMMLALGALAPFGAVKLSGWLVRGGLVNVGGSYQGKRLTAAEKAAGAVAGEKERAPLFRGIVGKEIRLLARDRTFFVQTLVVPVFVIALQFVINEDLLHQLTAGTSHVATIAFGIGAYVLLFGGFNSLASEGPSLWLLYTFPEPIERIIRRKALLWGAISSVYSLAIIAIVLAYHPDVSPAALANMALALAGVFIYAYVATGLGVLGVNPLETEPRRRIRPEMSQAFMLLAALYAYALYAPSVWAKIGTVTLCILMTYAIWQKVRDNAPFLLDPTQLPPPRVALSDGLIAALFFFVLQGVFALIAVAGELMSQGAAITVGYAAAGALVTGGTLFVFWRRKVPGVLRAVGILPEPGKSPLWRTAAIGLAGGLAAATVGLVYLRVIDRFEPLRALRDEYAKSPLDSFLGHGWLILIAVAAAPLFEEFIFRGLVFRGLRRSLPFGLAMVAGAAIFAVVHPAISALPVFALGLATAACFEMTGFLLAPILAHMTYNFIVLVISPML